MMPRILTASNALTFENHTCWVRISMRGGDGAVLGEVNRRACVLDFVRGGWELREGRVKTRRVDFPEEGLARLRNQMAS
jgi:hypothetical protein